MITTTRFFDLNKISDAKVLIGSVFSVYSWQEARVRDSTSRGRVNSWLHTMIVEGTKSWQLMMRGEGTNNRLIPTNPADTAVIYTSLQGQTIDNWAWPCWPTYWIKPVGATSSSAVKQWTADCTWREVRWLTAEWYWFIIVGFLRYHLIIPPS